MTAPNSDYVEPQLRVSPTMARVVKVFLAEPSRPRYGYEMLQEAQLPTGTVYPILAGLTRLGWLAASWETVDPSLAGRPKRKLYRLTPYGHEQALNTLSSMADIYTVTKGGRS